jgi:hypothetical protein
MLSADIQGRSQTVEAWHLDIAYDDVGHFQIHGSHQCSSIRHDAKRHILRPRLIAAG